jgi:hypothetical protein
VALVAQHLHQAVLAEQEHRLTPAVAGVVLEMAQEQPLAELVVFMAAAVAVVHLLQYQQVARGHPVLLSLHTPQS